jgi:CRISPR-associated protein Csx3
MNELTAVDREVKAMKLNIGDRTDFELVEFSNSAGLKVSLYENGGTHCICHDNLMVNQLEGHPFQGGLDRIYLRRHTVDGIKTLAMTGTAGECVFFENGAEWKDVSGNLTASVQLCLHPELPVLYRVCRAENKGVHPVMLDWMAGQDVGLADPGALKSNEAYVCQYLDHKIVDHSTAGKVVFSRNNLHPKNPFMASFCMEGAVSASTDGYQFFGAESKMDGTPTALGAQTLENRVRQYEFAYAALQSRQIELQPGQSCETVFALYLVDEHHDVSSSADLEFIDHALKEELPALAGSTTAAFSNAFFATTPLMPVQELSDIELKTFFGNEWRHTEESEKGELFSFFCGDDTHVVLPAKERFVERAHGTILKSAHGAALDDHVLCVTCYGFGVFGSQFSVGNTSFGRFTTILRNSLGLDRSSGIRLFVETDRGWKQLGYPSVFAMERDVCRWVYKTSDCIFEVVASASAGRIEYKICALSGELPPMRTTLEVCGDANEFDAAPGVELDDDENMLVFTPADGSLQKQKFPDTCMLVKVASSEGWRVGGAELLGGSSEPYVVLDFPSAEKFSLVFSAHLEGRTAAFDRMQAKNPHSWDALLGHFALKPVNSDVVRLSDTIKWYAHNAMIHYAAPRGMEQYGGGAWGTRDVCQGPLEFMLALGHDKPMADMLCEVFCHQYADTGIWPQWFMFDGFATVQQHESHGDIVFWPIKALCDYIEQTGDFKILEKPLPYTDPESFDFTKEKVSLQEHVKLAVDHIYNHCVEGTALPCYGDGDWNDSLQPANQEMKTHMVSGWTVGLAYQSLSELQKVWKGAGYADDAEKLATFLERMHNDFQTHILKDGIAAGFVLFNGDGTTHMLHPSDTDNDISYRLLPTNRSIISELFTPAEKDSHLDLVDAHLKFPDGVRLMDRPPEYTGGKSVHFQRAETASHFGREIGLQYVHAHIRYCEALAKVGRAEELLDGLLATTPVAIKETVPNARPRQANLYFSSSDADVYDRYEAAERMDDLKKGEVGALGGWRLYSSGPGIYIGLVINRLFGIRRSYGRVVLDPVLPKSMDGAELDLDWNGKRVRWVFHVKSQAFDPVKVIVNHTPVEDYQRMENPYRAGGISIDSDTFDALLNGKENIVEIHL